MGDSPLITRDKDPCFSRLPVGPTPILTRRALALPPEGHSSSPDGKCMAVAFTLGTSLGTDPRIWRHSPQSPEWDPGQVVESLQRGCLLHLSCLGGLGS
jgi:hypothetical protein